MGVKKVALAECCRFLIRDFEDRVFLDVMDDLGRPQGRYPESFVLISLLEVCQEVGSRRGGQEEGYLEDVEGSR